MPTDNFVQSSDDSLRRHFDRRTFTCPPAVPEQPAQEESLCQSDTNAIPWLNDDCNPLMEQSPATTFNGHDHTCHICAKPHLIKGCSEFQRHIRERYEQYHCADCDKVFSRKETLRDHREKYHRSDDSSVTDDISPRIKKRYFACGYCTLCCNSPKVLAKHIHNHVKFQEQVPPWDFNNVILGLLSSVETQWKNALEVNGPFPRSWYSWDSTLRQVQELRENLELGLEQPEALVAAAITYSNHSTSELGHVEPPRLQAPKGLEMNRDQPMPTLLHRDVSSPPLPISGLDPTPFPPPMDYPFMSSMNHQAGHPPQSYGSLNSGQGLEYQYPANVPSMPPASSLSQASGGQGGISYLASYSGYPQSASPYDTTNLHTRQMAGAPSYSAPSPMNWYQPPLANNFTSSSSLAPHTNAYNIPKVDVQHSPQEIIDYRGSDTYDDSNRWPR